MGVCDNLANYGQKFGLNGSLNSCSKDIMHCTQFCAMCPTQLNDSTDTGASAPVTPAMRCRQEEIHIYQGKHHHSCSSGSYVATTATSACYVIDSDVGPTILYTEQVQRLLPTLWPQQQYIWPHRATVRTWTLTPLRVHSRRQT